MVEVPVLVSVGVGELPENRTAHLESGAVESVRNLHPADSSFVAKLEALLHGTPHYAVAEIVSNLAKEGWLEAKQTKGRIDEVTDRLIEAAFEQRRED